MFPECKTSTFSKLGAGQQTRESTRSNAENQGLGTQSKEKNTDPKSGMIADKEDILIWKLVFKCSATRDLFNLRNVQTSQALLKGKSQPVLQSI